jgi:hypothetical protein
MPRINSTQSDREAVDSLILELEYHARELGKNIGIDNWREQVRENPRFAAVCLGFLYHGQEGVPFNVADYDQKIQQVFSRLPLDEIRFENMEHLLTLSYSQLEELVRGRDGQDRLHQETEYREREEHRGFAMTLPEIQDMQHQLNRYIEDGSFEGLPIKSTDVVLPIHELKTAQHRGTQTPKQTPTVDKSQREVGARSDSFYRAIKKSPPQRTESFNRIMNQLTEVLRQQQQTIDTLVARQNQAPTTVVVNPVIRPADVFVDVRVPDILIDNRQEIHVPPVQNQVNIQNPDTLRVRFARLSRLTKALLGLAAVLGILLLLFLIVGCILFFVKLATGSAASTTAAATTSATTASATTVSSLSSATSVTRSTSSLVGPGRMALAGGARAGVPSMWLLITSLMVSCLSHLYQHAQLFAQVKLPQIFNDLMLMGSRLYQFFVRCVSSRSTPIAQEIQVVNQQLSSYQASTGNHSVSTVRQRKGISVEKSQKNQVEEKKTSQVKSQQKKEKAE